MYMLESSVAAKKSVRKMPSKRSNEVPRREDCHFCSDCPANEQTRPCSYCTVVNFKVKGTHFSPHVQELLHSVKLQISAFVLHVNVHVLVNSVLLHFDAWKLRFPSLEISVSTGNVISFALDCSCFTINGALEKGEVCVLKKTKILFHFCIFDNNFGNICRSL